LSWVIKKLRFWIWRKIVSNTFTYKIKIDASPERIWKILSDFGGIQNYNPYIVQAFLTSHEKTGVGMVRHCELAPWGMVVEQVVEWNEGSDYTLEVVKGSGQQPFKYSRVKIGLIPASGSTEVFITMDYLLRFGPIGEVMDALMINRSLKKKLPTILNGLKHFAETGENVDFKLFKKLPDKAAPVENLRVVI
jgi:hypothetical protein